MRGSTVTCSGDHGSLPKQVQAAINLAHTVPQALLLFCWCFVYLAHEGGYKPCGGPPLMPGAMALALPPWALALALALGG